VISGNGVGECGGPSSIRKDIARSKYFFIESSRTISGVPDLLYQLAC
jgi:hypothetical protein